jgi:hypothetical protein
MSSEQKNPGVPDNAPPMAEEKLQDTPANTQSGAVANPPIPPTTTPTEDLATTPQSVSDATPPDPATRATTRPVKIRLDHLLLKPETYSHRDPAELNIEKPEKIRSLADNIAEIGLQTPVEFYREKDGQPVVTKGHRRVSALRLLAKENKPGFTPDMLVEAIEVSGVSQKELVVRSVVDNVFRLDYSDADRIRAAKTLSEFDVDEKRAAKSLGISVKTYLRLLLVSNHPWMFDLINRNCMPISYAPNLLEAAERKKRILELEQYLAKWVPEKEDAIELLKKTQTLSVTKQLVKSYVSKPLVDHWIAQILKEENLNDIVPRTQEVTIDPEKRKVSLNIHEVDVFDKPLPEMAKLVGEIETAKQLMLRALKVRHAMEAARGPQDSSGQVNPASEGLDYLRAEGLGDLADQVEHGLVGEVEQPDEQTQKEVE